MDFWSQKQGCRLPFTTSGTPEKTPKESNRTKSMWINVIRAVTTRSRSRQPEIDKETKKPQPKKTNSNKDTTRNDSPDNSRDTSI